MSFVDGYKHKYPLITSQFLPFKNYQSPGVIILPERSSNFVYLHVEEGASRMKSNFNTYDVTQSRNYDSWNLRFNKLRAENAGP